MVQTCIVCKIFAVIRNVNKYCLHEMLWEVVAWGLKHCVSAKTTHAIFLETLSPIKKHFGKTCVV